MRDLMKMIDGTRIELTLTLEEAMELKKILGKRVHIATDARDGKQTCPNCGTEVHKGYNYCKCCGQAVLYNDKFDMENVVPL